MDIDIYWLNQTLMQRDQILSWTLGLVSLSLAKFIELHYPPTFFLLYTIEVSIYLPSITNIIQERNEAVKYLFMTFNDVLGKTA